MSSCCCTASRARPRTGSRSQTGCPARSTSSRWTGQGTGRASSPPGASGTAPARSWLSWMRAASARAVLVGHSYGGGVALSVAQLAPERVEALVLLASVGPDCLTGWDRLLAAPVTGEVCAVTAWWLTPWLARARLAAIARRRAGTHRRRACQLGHLGSRPSRSRAAVAQLPHRAARSGPASSTASPRPCRHLAAGAADRRPGRHAHPRRHDPSAGGRPARRPRAAAQPDRPSPAAPRGTPDRGRDHRLPGLAGQPRRSGRSPDAAGPGRSAPARQGFGRLADGEAEGVSMVSETRRQARGAHRRGQRAARRSPRGCSPRSPSTAPRTSSAPTATGPAPNLKGWKDQLLAQSIQPIQQFAYTRGKNATDAAMVIDAMDLLYSGRFDGFCIVSSDSDFTRLAARLRESGADRVRVRRAEDAQAVRRGVRQVHLHREPARTPRRATPRPRRRGAQPAPRAVRRPSSRATPRW